MKDTNVPVEKWVDKDSWCVSVIAEAMLFAQTNPIGKSASHLTEALREKVREEINRAIQAAKEEERKRIAEEVEKLKHSDLSKKCPDVYDQTTLNEATTWSKKKGANMVIDEVLSIISGK